jgi:pyruvate dehydrogenase E2 component (dihydrolipoamide acetyltransferase)
MRREITMPVVSDEAEEGVLVTWFVVPPASVREGDLVAEVQVEKVSEEVHAPADGTLVATLVEQGGVVAQGAAIGVLEVGAPEGGPPSAPPSAPAGAPAGATAEAPGAPAPASPSARRLAKELGVDLGGVAGSGPGGRIVEADVRAAAEGAGPAAPAKDAGTGPAAEPVSAMRRAIATRLTAGLREAAQLTITAEADLTDLEAELARRREGAPARPTYTAAIVAACARALGAHPRLAASLTEEGLVGADSLDVGVAVALEDGLIVPVVRAADTKGVVALAGEIADLAARAREGRLEREETAGAVFSVTSLGAHRVDAFTPLLDLPQTAILGVGRARPRPAVVAGQIVPRTLCVLSLTFDHRAVDGAPAAAFLDDVIAALEGPAELP